MWEEGSGEVGGERGLCALPLPGLPGNPSPPGLPCPQLLIFQKCSFKTHNLSHFLSGLSVHCLCVWLRSYHT